MDDIIKSVGRSEYDRVGVLIRSSNQLTQNELERLLYFFVYKLIDKQLTEAMFLQLFDHVNQTTIEFDSVRHFRRIVDLLNDDNYLVASEILVVASDMKAIHQQIAQFVGVVMKSNGQFGHRMMSVSGAHANRSSTNGTNSILKCIDPI